MFDYILQSFLIFYNTILLRISIFNYLSYSIPIFIVIFIFFIEWVFTLFHLLFISRTQYSFFLIICLSPNYPLLQSRLNRRKLSILAIKFFFQFDSERTSFVATAMKNQIINILGQLGPPDLLTVDHGTFPNRPGDPLKDWGSNICNLKAR